MSTLFNACQNDSGSTLSTSAVPTEEVTAESVKYSAISSRQEKILKKICRLLKKKNKLLKREIKRQNVEKNSAKKGSTKREIGIEAKGFFRELGKAICKAIPAVLTTLTTMAFNFIFMRQRKNGKSGLQFA